MTFLATLPLFIGGMRGWQLIFIIAMGVLLFGGVKRIPEIMRSLGKGVHSFKQGIEDAKEEMNKPIRKAGTQIDEAINDRPAAKDVDGDK